MMTAPITANICPIMPSTSSMGMKVTTLVSTPKITGTATSWAPRIAPRRRSPVRTCWV